MDLTQKVYLDNNATTPLAPEVLTAIYNALKDDWGNPSSAHETGKRAKQTIASARKHIAEMIGASADDIIFTSGGTEANNTVLYSVLKDEKKQQGIDNGHKVILPHIITSNIEHDSIRLVLDNFVRENLAEVTFVSTCQQTGQVRPEDVVAALRPNTRLVSVMMANNETGVVQPIREIVDKVRQASGKSRPILFHTDAAQCFGKIHVNVDDLAVDFMTIVGHKFYGPRIGALYVRGPRVHTTVHPVFIGGGQERAFRPGTENTGMIAGLGKAAELIRDNLDVYESHMREMRDTLERKLKEEFGDSVVINCRRDDVERLPNTSNISFIGDGLFGYKVLQELPHVEASVGAACHTGSHKPSHILINSGVPESIAANAIRLSSGRQTSVSDIDTVVADFKLALKRLQA